MDTAKLHTLLIKEISGVDDPANQLPGWAVLKARGQPKPVEKLHHLDSFGASAVIHDDSDFVTVYKADGSVVEIAKSALDPAVVSTSPSSLDGASAVRAHQSEQQLRHPATGKFTRGIWRHVGPKARDATSVFLS